jgi:predicted transcriptional regulator
MRRRLTVHGSAVSPLPSASMPDAAPSSIPALHELESRVMDELWTLGEASVREVMQAVNAGAPRELAYTTIMTTLQRLYRKQVVDRRREGKTDIYSPRWSRAEHRSARARVEVAALVDQYGDEALVHFTRQVGQLDAKTRAKLRRLARDA